MAGGFTKTAGGLLILIGCLVFVAGVGSAAYGFLQERDNQERLIPDPEGTDLNEALVVYGLLGGGVGILLVLFGIVLLVVGGHQAQALLRHEIRQASQPGSGTGATASAAPRRRPLLVVLGLVVAVGLVAMLGWIVMAAGWAIGPNSVGHPLSTDQPEAWHSLGAVSFEGRVTYGASEPTGSRTLDSTQSEKEFEAPARTGSLALGLAWDTQNGGSDDLRVILEVQEGAAWREVARQGGPSPLAMSVESLDLDGAHLRYRVFANAAASLVVDQAFAVNIEFFAPAG